MKKYPRAQMTGCHCLHSYSIQSGLLVAPLAAVAVGGNGAVGLVEVGREGASLLMVVTAKD
jgi:hypothetical protein